MASGRKICNRDRQGGNRGDPCSEPVEDVNDVQRIRDRQNPEHGQRNRNPYGEKCELDVRPRLYQHERRHGLAKKLLEWCEHPEVVDQADRQRDTSRKKQTQRLLAKICENSDGQQKGRVHGYTAEIRHGRFVIF